MSIEKIIVLEDDAIVRTNLENFLRRQRFDVAPPPTLAAARDYLNRDNFDLIFMDMRLPDGEGIELLKELQTRPQRPLAVVMTGFGSVESAVECMKNGAFDYLIKPFSTDQIEFTLRKAQEFNQLLKVNTLLEPGIRRRRTGSAGPQSRRWIICARSSAKSRARRPRF